MMHQFIIGLLFATGIASVSYRFGLLTQRGAVAQFILGTILFGLGAWQWTMPIFLFFLLSSLLSTIGKKHRAAAELFFEKSFPRDAWQVLANGGVAGVFVIWWSLASSDALYVAYLGAVAAVTADTWGTEFGTLSKTPPRLITTFDLVEHGRSGAVSLAGFMAGIAGCGVIYMSGIPWLVHSTPALVSVFAGGILGALSDSLIGATIQCRKVCPACGRIVERDRHCGEVTRRSGGLDWMRNDQVNLLASTVGASSALLCYLFLR